ncbi:MAG: division/cell wall cluster transcriptional repressor MraZ [Candidatus Parcubacteria bacterium]|nr:division/cell wall cluster transcriptional repressor MraZ [Candidatus Parcubacteria bacterium]
MFIGEYHHSIDPKGRLSLPVRFKSELAGGAVLTRGIDNCLFLWPKSAWTPFVNKIQNLPLTQANPRAFARLMLGGAMEVELDAQGRILIPNYLEDYAKLGKKAVIIGLNDRLEIWDEDSYKDYQTKTEKASAEIAEQLVF